MCILNLGLEYIVCVSGGGGVCAREMTAFCSTQEVTCTRNVVSYCMNRSHVEYKKIV
jgi:hypothetical protein